MKVSKQFLKDFAYLANRYGWTPAEIEEMKAAVKANEASGRRYITELAAAHRAGYEQTRENNYIRLHAWCAEKELPDPYSDTSIEEAQGVGPFPSPEGYTP